MLLLILLMCYNTVVLLGCGYHDHIEDTINASLTGPEAVPDLEPVGAIAFADTNLEAAISAAMLW
jgi:hypothetical protein